MLDCVIRLVRLLSVTVSTMINQAQITDNGVTVAHPQRVGTSGIRARNTEDDMLMFQQMTAQS